MECPVVDATGVVVEDVDGDGNTDVVLGDVDGDGEVDGDGNADVD